VSQPRPGLAVERTVLAWTRTWLSVGACGLLLLRMSVGSAPRLALALTAGALAIAVTTAVGRRRAARLREIATTPDELRPPVRAATATAATVALFGLAAAALVATR
jgi:uncharacterized membrane protein YidH (DUF202 family)